MVDHVEAVVTFSPNGREDAERLIDLGVMEREERAFSIDDVGDRTPAIQVEGEVRLLDCGWVAVRGLHAVFPPSLIHNIQPSEDYAL